MKKLILFLSLFLFACHLGQTNKEIKCEENINQAIRCFEEYKFYDDSIKLDSALLYLSDIEGKCEGQQQTSIKFLKIQICMEKKNYKDAVKIMESITDSFTPPELKQILIDKIKVREAKEIKDENKLHELYSDIVYGYERALTKDMIDSLINLPWTSEPQISRSYRGLLPELFYYKAKVEGVDKVLSEIDSLKLVEGANQEFLDKLKKYVIPDEHHNAHMIFE